MTDQELAQLLGWISLGMSLLAISYNVYVELMIRKYKKKLRK